MMASSNVKGVFNGKSRKIRGAGIFFCLSVFLLLSGASLVQAQQQKQTAEKLFSELPVDIFENTSHQLSEQGKQELLLHGFHDGWVVKENTENRMAFQHIESSSEEVIVSVFRRENGTGVVALSASTADGCLSELWAFSSRGGLVPFSEMEEANQNDFLLASHTVPKGTTTTYVLCPEEDFFIAVPAFWGEDGALSIKADNEVFYVWTGESFQKIVRPVPEDLRSLGRTPPADTPGKELPVTPFED